MTYRDRVKETTTTTGTGTLSLGGAATGYRSFASALVTGEGVSYGIEDGTNWEVGEGTFTTAGATLSRTTIIASSNSGAAVSWGAGTKSVFLTVSARHIVPHVSFRSFGAVGNGTTDDTVAVQAALDSANLNGALVYPGYGTFKITSTLFVRYRGLTLHGEGSLATLITFAPTADNDVLFHLEHVSDGNYGYLSNVRFENLGITMTGVRPAVAVYMQNVSRVELNHVGIWNFYGTTGTSIGVKIAGREYITLRYCTILSDLPLDIQKCTEFPTNDADFFHVEMVGFGVTVGEANPNIRLANDLRMMNSTFEDISMTEGSYGVYWSDTTAVNEPHNITFRNIRWELAPAGGWMIYISRTAGYLNNLVLDQLYDLSDAATHGVYLRKVQRGILQNSLFNDSGWGSTTAVDIASCPGFYVDSGTNRYGGGALNYAGNQLIVQAMTGQNVPPFKVINDSEAEIASVNENGTLRSYGWTDLADGGNGGLQIDPIYGFIMSEVALKRSAAGVFEINSGTAGVFRDLLLRALGLGAGTTTIAPLKYTSGTNLTTPVAGATEYDGKAFYSTPAARGVSPSVQLICPASDFTLVSGTGVQSVFPTTCDVITVVAGTSYFFKGQYILNTGATTHTTALAFELGGSASVTSFEYVSYCHSAALNTMVNSGICRTHVSGVASKAINSTSAGVYTTITFEGLVRINAGGTVTPQINFSADPTGTNLTKVGSWLRWYPIGSDSVEQVGSIA